MAEEITPWLLSALSVDAKVRHEAEGSLRVFHEKNLSAFLLSLSTELCNNDKPIESRRLAGIVLKNSLDSKDNVRIARLPQQWISVEASVKSQIKSMLLNALESPTLEARNTSALVIAKIVKAEIQNKSWRELIESLLANMTHQDRPGTLKQATLVTLGYICEEISHHDLGEEHVNSILTEIIQRMGLPERCPEVRLSATKALYKAIDFAQTKFVNVMEQVNIMKVFCEAASSKEPEIRQAAFECLVSVASTYYDVLEPFMEALFMLTSNAVKKDKLVIALQAVEFWSTICDKEIDYEDNRYGASASPSFCLIKKALSDLVPLLLETLLRKEEDQDHRNSAWTLSQACGTCLCLAATTVGDDIVPLVMPFVVDKIVKPDWRCRDAAAFAFGSILEGPSIGTLSPWVHVCLNFFLNTMKDENNLVKDRTAWTLCRIFEFLPVSVASPALQRVVQVLLESIEDTPNIAEKGCKTLYYIAQGHEKTKAISSSLSGYLPNIVSGLFMTADRTDGSEMNLSSSAYETLEAIVRWADSSEMFVISSWLLPEIVSRLSQTLELQSLSSNDREKQGVLQAHLCRVIQVTVQKFSSDGDTKFIKGESDDNLMTLLLGVLGCRCSTGQEEAMSAIGSLAATMGPKFEKHMPNFYQYLAKGLDNFSEPQACEISIGVVGTISRALKDQILPYCDYIMRCLLTNVSNEELHPCVKLSIFSCFGDIAVAIGVNFEQYLSSVIPTMDRAAETCASINSKDEDIIDYGNRLRLSILEGYRGLMLGFEKNLRLMRSPAAKFLHFVEVIFRDEHRDEDVTKAAVTIIHDVVSSLGSEMTLQFNDPAFVGEILNECSQSYDKELKEMATKILGMIRRYLRA